MTSRSIETIIDLASVSLSILGITSALLAEFYLVRMAERRLVGKQPGARREARLAFMVLVRGPICGIIILLFMLPVVNGFPGFQLFDLVGVGVVLIIMGM